MTDGDQVPLHSPLAQSLTRDGKTVQIDIYADGEGGWLLEVIDEHGNSTVWDDPFQSDQDALDEALRTIEEEGAIWWFVIHHYGDNNFRHSSSGKLGADSRAATSMAKRFCDRVADSVS